MSKGTKTPKPREEWVIQKGAHEAIVGNELWEAVEVRRKEIQKYIKAGKGNSKGAYSTHLLTGLILCQECGANFTMNTSKARGRVRQYYRCSYHWKRGDAVCTNGRGVKKEVVEDTVLDLLKEKLLTKETIEDLLQDVRAELREQQSSPDNQVEELQKQIRRVEKETENLTAAVKVGGPIEQLVRELQACGERKVHLEAEKHQMEASLQPIELEDVTAREIKEGIENLRNTLEYATAAERRVLLSENIKSILVPEKGPALLEADPEGLLSNTFYIKVVTPREVLRKIKRRGKVYRLDV